MRNKVELKNGVTLEIGKKYIVNPERPYQHRWYKVLFIGEDSVFLEDYNGDELSFVYRRINWIPYEEEQTEKWYEVIVYNSFGVGNRRCCNEINLKNYECQIDIIREWDSKEEMINDLKK